MRRLLLAAAGAALLFTGTAQAAPETLATEAAPFTADARAGVIAWSSYDPAADAYRLRLRLADGSVVTPAIPTRGLPFDVDLGRDPSGRPAAVYSRCAQQGHRRREDGFIDVPQAGCDLWLYDIGAATERRIAASSSGRFSETLPSLDGDRIAFVRTVPGRPARDVPYIGRVAGAPASERQPGPRARNGGSMASVELERGRLLYVFNGLEGRYGFGDSILYRVRGDESRAIYVTGSGGANASRVVGLHLTPRRVYFAETNNGSGAGNRLYRSTYAGRDLEEARGSTDIGSVSWTGTRFVLARGFEFGCDARSPCTLQLTDPPAFTPAG